MKTPRGYSITKVYIIICDKCNEDITRAQSGVDVTSEAEARDYIAEHERVWHK